MSDVEQQAAFMIFRGIGVGAVGGLIVMVLGNRIRGSSEAALKRKRFRSFLELLSRKIEAKAASDFVHSHELKEIAKLEAEVLEVRHHIQSRLIGRFDNAFSRYKAAGFDGWAGPDQNRQQARDTKNEKSKAELISNLDELFRCAWWMA